MRVSLDYRPALYTRTGIARVARELARALDAIGGVDLHLFGHGLKAPLDDIRDAPGRLHRTRLPGRSLNTLARFGVDAARLSGRPAVFHWTDYSYPPLRRGARAPRVVLTVHDVAFLEADRWHGATQSRVLAKRFEHALARADAVVCPTRAAATALRRLTATTKPLHVIPFGIEHARQGDAGRGRELAREALGTGDDYCVVLGTLEPRKNHTPLLDALCILAGQGRCVPLVVIGAPGWHTNDVQSRLHAADLPFPCAWTGPICDRDCFDLVAAARALVYPSSLEGFGFPPLEALALGVPVLAGNCEALVETLGDAAVFVQGDDAAAIAAGLPRLLDDETLRATLLETWHTRAECYSWKTCAARHVEVYADS